MRPFPSSARRPADPPCSLEREPFVGGGVWSNKGKIRELSQIADHYSWDEDLAFDLRVRPDLNCSYSRADKPLGADHSRRTMA